MNLSKNKLNLYSSLGSSKMRRRHALFMVEGRKSVEESLKNWEVEAVIALEEADTSFIPVEIAIYRVGPKEMSKVSNLVTQSDLIAVLKIPDNSDQSLECLDDQLYVGLDGVRDPGNFGTIIRTCHWFGVKKIFASFDCVDFYNPKVIQATMGSFSRVEVIYCDLSELIERNRQIDVYGLQLDGENIYKSQLSEGGILIMGNEGKGISPQIKKLIKKPLLIPPGGENHSESLNVAVATGITLSQFRSR